MFYSLFISYFCTDVYVEQSYDPRNMNKLNNIAFWKKSVFSDVRFLFSLWLIIAVIGGIKGSRIHNNYLIFKGVFYHTIEQLKIYAPYPNEYHDVNHYGPFFSLIIAPFALLPDRLGMILWDVCMGMCLFFAIYKLPIKWDKKYLFYYILLIAYYTCVMNCQTNGFIASLIIATLLFVRKEKDIWAGFCIALGVFIKLYGIVGLCFFFFSKHKLKFIISCIAWSALFFVLPMLISSPQYIWQSYIDWFTELGIKNHVNITNYAQNLSVIGFVRRNFGLEEISDLWIIVPGIILFGLQYIKIKEYGKLTYQLAILASTLLFIVLFSSGSESETYVIALTGVCIWFSLHKQPYKWWVISLLIFTVFWTWFTSAPIFPRSTRLEFFGRYSLKAVPYFIIWIILIYQILQCKFADSNIEKEI